MIKFSKVSKSYQGLNVIDSLSFTVLPGEIVGILGPSGSGKTTILRLIAKLIKPDIGNIEVDGSNLGYVFQEPRLLPWKRVIDNVSLPLLAQKKSKQEATRLAHIWLEKVGLSDFEQFYPAELSGGMQQRVALARAFVIEPNILLLDEPFSSLDNGRKGQLLQILQIMIQETGLTGVYVTHDMTELLKIADRILLFDEQHRLQELDLNDRHQLLLNYISSLMQLDSSSKLSGAQT